MTTDKPQTAVGDGDAAAYAAHYSHKNLSETLALYRAIIGSYPESQEAEYSRSQVLNIVKAVVPKDEAFDAQVALALDVLHSPHTPEETTAPTREKT